MSRFLTPLYRLRRAFAGAPRRPVEGRRTAPGHPHMTALRWAGVVTHWALLFSPLIVAILLFVVIVWF